MKSLNAPEIWRIWSSVVMDSEVRAFTRALLRPKRFNASM
jgi:hypothetical protein